MGHCHIGELAVIPAAAQHSILLQHSILVVFGWYPTQFQEMHFC